MKETAGMQICRAVIGLGISLLLSCGLMKASAQEKMPMHLQLHGYATQSLVYSSANNWNGMTSSDGSLAWQEGVFNAVIAPRAHVRIGAQVRDFRMGDFGNKFTLDWASIDVKVNDKFGFRAGKVKTPNGLLNDIQDIDPAFLWSLLPQSLYPITSRNSILAHYGVVVYGDLPLGARGGSLEYQAYAGRRKLAASDGFFVPFNESGVYYPNGLSGPTMGGTLRWHLPVKGLMLGVAGDREDMTGAISIPALGLTGQNVDSPFEIPFVFGRYEHKKFMFAAEYSRVPADHRSVFTTGPLGVQHIYLDRREWDAMSSYKLTSKLNAGLYYSSSNDKKTPAGVMRYQKDWALAACYEFNQYLYLKAEQHFIDGEAFGYLSKDNINLQPTTRLSIVKLGVSF